VGEVGAGHHLVAEGERQDVLLRLDGHAGRLRRRGGGGGREQRGGQHGRRQEAQSGSHGGSSGGRGRSSRLDLVRILTARPDTCSDYSGYSLRGLPSGQLPPPCFLVGGFSIRPTRKDSGRSVAGFQEKESTIM